MDESCDPKKDYDPEECPKYCNVWRACAILGTGIATDYKETLSLKSRDVVVAEVITYNKGENE